MFPNCPENSSLSTFHQSRALNGDRWSRIRSATEIQRTSIVSPKPRSILTKQWHQEFPSSLRTAAIAGTLVNEMKLAIFMRNPAPITVDDAEERISDNRIIEEELQLRSAN